MQVLLPLALFVLGLLQGEADEQLRYLAGLASKGMSAELEREAQSFLREYPRHARADEARYRLACALFEQHKPQPAAELLRPLSTRRGFEFESEALFRLGQCELELGRPAEAVAALERTLELGKEYLLLPAGALHADALLAADRTQDAERAFAAVLERGVQSEYAPDAACGLAWCAFKRRDFEAVIERARQFLAAFPRNPRAGEVQFLRGEALLETGKADAAIEAYAKVGEGAFADGALRGAAFAHAAQGRHTQAASLFQALLERFPQSRFVAEARLQCGVERLAAGDAAGALKMLDAKSAGERGEGAYWRAKALSAGGDAQAALELAARASRGEQDEGLGARWAALRADLLTALGRPDEARAAYEAADSDYALQAGAVASLEAKRPEEALRLARKLLERNPNSPYRLQALLAAAEGLYALEQYAQAEPAFLAAAESDTDKSRRDKTRLRAAWCRYLQKQPAEAAAMFQELARTLADAKQADEAAYMAARASEDAGDLRAARSGYERYLQRFPQGERRAQALLSSARLIEGPAATQRLEAALADAPDGASKAELHFELAERLSKAGSFEAAAGHYRAAQSGAAAPELRQPCVYGLAWCEYSQGEFARAAATLAPLLAASSPAHDATLMESALELSVWAKARAGSIEAALADWQSLQARSRDDARVWSCARVLLGALEGPEAQRARAQLLAQAARSVKSPELAAEIDAELALCAMAGGERERALQLLDGAWSRAPKSVCVREAACSIGEACASAGDAKTGQDILRALARDESAARADRAVYQLALWRMAAGDAKGARTDLARFAQRFPASTLQLSAQFLEAEACYRSGDLARALSGFEALARTELGAELAPKVLFRLGLLHCQNGRWAEGLDELTRLGEQFPKFENLLEAQLWRGRALAQRKDAAAARQLLEGVVAKDKGMLGAQARLALGELALAEGDAQAALSAFLKVAVLYSDVELVAQANWGAGQAFERGGELDKARQSYREVLAKAPDSAQARSARARLAALETP